MRISIQCCRWNKTTENTWYLFRLASKIHFSENIWGAECLCSAATFRRRCCNWRRSKIQRIEANIRGICRFAARLQLNGNQEKQIEEKTLHTGRGKKKSKGRSELKGGTDSSLANLCDLAACIALTKWNFFSWFFCTVQCTAKFLRIPSFIYLLGLLLSGQSEGVIFKNTFFFMA